MKSFRIVVGIAASVLAIGAVLMLLVWLYSSEERVRTMQASVLWIATAAAIVWFLFDHTRRNHVLPACLATGLVWLAVWFYTSELASMALDQHDRATWQYGAAPVDVVELSLLTVVFALAVVCFGLLFTALAMQPPDRPLYDADDEWDDLEEREESKRWRREHS